MEQYRVQVDTDCEGPICLNDNAYELCAKFLPHGKRFFKQLSPYDDILYLNKKKYPFIQGDYATGDTLRLILPFLRNYDVNNKIISLFVDLKKIKWMHGAKSVHKYLHERELPVYEISTSYEPFALAVAKVIQVEPDKVFSTRVNLDKYFFTKEERKKLNNFLFEIVNMPTIHVNGNGGKEPKLERAIDRLNEIFWGEMPKMDCWELISKTKVMNGMRKVDAISQSLSETHYDFEDVVYIGDSITDKEALEFTKRKGGLAIAFNGNSHAIQEAEVACIGNNSIVIGAVIDAYARGRRDAVHQLIDNWDSKDYLKQTLPDEIFAMIVNKDVIVNFITDSNRCDLIDKSTMMRRRIRKEAGRLS
jgi:energy-converting hydrogenase A subunit R